MVPDIKKQLMDFLSTHMSVPIVARRPESPDRPAAFIRVLSTGGTGVTQKALCTALETIDSYAQSSGEAMKIACEAVNVAHTMPNYQDGIVMVQSSYPIEMPDPDTSQARATATLTITAHR
jgi:hypothetical protein